MELTKNNMYRSKLSYNLQRNIVNLLTLTGKQTERNTQRKLSTTYQLIMSIFSLFHFVASVKLLVLLSG